MGDGQGWGNPQGAGTDADALGFLAWAHTAVYPKQATFFLQTCFLLCELGFEKYCPALLPRLRVVGTQSSWLQGPEVCREHAFWSQAV